MPESDKPLITFGGVPIPIRDLGLVGGFESLGEAEEMTGTIRDFQSDRRVKTFQISTPMDPEARAALFGIPVVKLPREERPAIDRWQEVADERLSNYVRPSERYYPDEKPGHAFALDEINAHGIVTKRFYMPEAHIERLKGNEFSISTARSWVNWTPRLAARAAWRAVRRPKAMLRTFPRIRRLIDRRDSRG